MYNCFKTPKDDDMYMPLPGLGCPSQVFYIARVWKRFYQTRFLLGLHS